jgi:hypothetical protein
MNVTMLVPRQPNQIGDEHRTRSTPGEGVNPIRALPTGP